MSRTGFLIIAAVIVMVGLVMGDGPAMWHQLTWRDAGFGLRGRSWAHARRLSVEIQQLTHVRCCGCRNNVPGLDLTAGMAEQKPISTGEEKGKGAAVL
jgi:hypothetical protein